MPVVIPVLQPTVSEHSTLLCMVFVHQIDVFLLVHNCTLGCIMHSSSQVRSVKRCLQSGLLERDFTTDYSNLGFLMFCFFADIW